MTSPEKNEFPENESGLRLFLNSFYKTAGISIVAVPLIYIIIHDLKGPLTHREYVSETVACILGDKTSTPQK